MFIKDYFSNSKNKLSNKTTMYVCGPTVYDYPHVGNMRPVVIFDILHRLLKLNGEVDYTHNITDIDDKIIEKAITENKTEKEITEFYLKEYFKNLKDLNIVIPNNMPKVTDYIPEIIIFIKELIEKDFAYERNGSVYFDISKLETYGKIINLKLEELYSGEDFSDEKKSQLDFALWKKTTEGIAFVSPWSKGRPGWHTECAFFVENHYGNKGINIHGGGIDLKFPHHVNEMAQYFASTGTELAKNWMYVGHVHFEDEKMSKSLGNIISAGKFIETHSANVLRILLTQTQYSKPVNLNEDSINNAKAIISKIENTVLKQLKIQSKFEKTLDDEFIKVISNDLDTPNAYAYVFEQMKTLNITRKEEIFNKLLFNLGLLGINIVLDESKISEYQKALKANNFETSDLLRKEIILI